MQSNRFNLTDSKGESINQDFHKAASLAKESSYHFEESERYSKQAQYIESHSVEINRDLSQELYLSFANRFGPVNAAEMLNPSNQDKSFLNQEINHFIHEKAKDFNISAISEPNLKAQYQQDSLSYAEKYKPSRQMQNEQVFMFSNSSKGIDNSYLQQSTSSKFNEGQTIINDANTRIDSSPKDFVKLEQEKGVINALGGELIKNSKETLFDVGTAGGEVLNKGGDIMKRFEESEARIKAKLPKNM